MMETSKRFLYKLVEGQHELNLTKWGKQDKDLLFVVLVEEVGEIARALLNKYNSNKVKDGHKNIKEEIVQTMAVLVALHEVVYEEKRGGK